MLLKKQTHDHPEKLFYTFKTVN